MHWEELCLSVMSWWNAGEFIGKEAGLSLVCVICVFLLLKRVGPFLGYEDRGVVLGQGAVVCDFWREGSDSAQPGLEFWAEFSGANSAMDDCLIIGRWPP